MTLREITQLLNGQVCIGESQLDTEITEAFASDLMSDVLTLTSTPMLITGLCNMQTIRTCDMACLSYIIIVRNKKPTEEMIKLANDNGMVVITTEYSLFRTCGILYQAGIKSLF